MNNHSYAFVDGSYNIKTKVYGWGGFLIDQLGNKHILQGSGNDSSLRGMRNVAGEVLGAGNAIETALKLGMKELTVYYDYAGIEKWVTGEWKGKKKGTIAYIDLANRAIKSGLKLYFKHIKSHSGNIFNDEADRFAKKAVGLL